MTMHPPLEIILPTCNPGDSFAHTVASLAAQTDRRFSVLICDNRSTEGFSHLDAAQKKLASAGIGTQRLQTPEEFSQIEHWNWAHAQGQAEWLKPLSPGERLKPMFIEKFKQRIAEKPDAQMMRCDLELHTEWGVEKQIAPFQLAGISRGEFTNYFPAHLDWISQTTNFVYRRAAWQAMGGFSKHLPGNAALNLNAMLSLHHGLENIPVTLVEADYSGEPCGGKNVGRTNRAIELWLILLQARNYCLSTKLPWTTRFLFLKSLTASLGHW